MSLFPKKDRHPQPTQGPDREQALSAVPVRNPDVGEVGGDSTAQDQSQGVILQFPAQVSPFFGHWAQKLGVWDGKPVYRKLQLDAMGTRSWRWIDGKRSVRELCELLADTYDLLPREAEVSMTAFLRELGRRSIIAMRAGG
jgi:hypothetical protein